MWFRACVAHICIKWDPGEKCTNSRGAIAAALAWHVAATMKQPAISRLQQRRGEGEGEDREKEDDHTLLEGRTMSLYVMFINRPCNKHQQAQQMS